MTTYTNSRPRGLHPWKPQQKTMWLLGQVQSILDEYSDHLPLTVRQVFYRLVGAFNYPKDDHAYARLLETMVRARRAQIIPFDSIRDDGVAEHWFGGFYGLPDFWLEVGRMAGTYRRDRLADQPVALELWCEAAGMVPQMIRVAEPYGVPVFSSGGFDSLTAKYETACRIMDENRPTVLISVGDLDPSGVSIFHAFAEDITAFVDDMGGDYAPDFVRAAVTREQITTYELEEAPAKKTDRRGDWQGGTVQVESLTPADLASEVDRVIREQLNLDQMGATLEIEGQERITVCRQVKSIMDEQS